MTNHALDRALLGIAVAIIVGGFVGALATSEVLLKGGRMAAVVTSTLVSQTNDERSEAGLSDLTVNPLLVAAAQAKADHMAANSYFSHTSPDGTTSWQWIVDQGYRFAYAGENLAVNFTDSRSVTDAWMASPTHRANIMNGRFTQVGIASAVGEYKGREAVFVVQMFGTPAGQSTVTAGTPVEIVAASPAEVAAGTVQGQRVLGEQVSEQGESAEQPAPASVDTSANPAAAAVAVNVAPDQVQSDVSGSEAANESVIIRTAEEAAASPWSALRVVYLVLAGALLLFLIIRAGIEFTHHHVRNAAVIAVLLVVMGVLTAIADRVFFVQPVIGATSSQDATEAATVTTPN